MASRPTKTPEWATDGGRVLEPSAGEKGTGWEVDKKPPARKMNWLQNLAYQWLEYLSDAIFVAASGSGLAGVDATGDNTAPGVEGTGGANNGRGVVGYGTGGGDGVRGQADAGASGAGVTGFGGTPAGAGVAGQGGGTGNGVNGTGGVSGGKGGNFVAAAGNADGTGGTGHGSGSGVAGTGGASSGSGVKGTGGAADGKGVEGIGTGAGAGVHGTGTNGYGVVAESDTTSPAKSALHVVPQNLEASGAAKGNVQIHEVNGKITNYTGNNWDRQIPQCRSSVVDESQTAGTSPVQFTAQGYTLPASTLRSRSTIRVRANGRITSVTGINTFIGLWVSDGTSAVSLSNQVNLTATGDFVFEAFLTARAGPGASVAVEGAILGKTTGGDDIVESDSNNLDTTQPITVEAYVKGSSTTNITAVLEQFIVDVV